LQFDGFVNPFEGKIQENKEGAPPGKVGRLEKMALLSPIPS
jgi:hypothetical protein